MYYVLGIVAIIIAFILIKKVVGCAIKAVIGVILLGILAFLYYRIKLG